MAAIIAPDIRGMRMVGNGGERCGLLLRSGGWLGRSDDAAGRCLPDRTATPDGSPAPRPIAQRVIAGPAPAG